MRRVIRRLVRGARHRLRAASLLEAVVAAVLFLTVFTVTMELLPRLTVRDDDALLVAEAEYRVGKAFEKYGTGLWPCGEYAENYDWGKITVRIEPYRNFTDLQAIGITARIAGSGKRIGHRQLVECGGR